MDYQKNYDKFINIALTNLFTLGKNNQTLNFYNYQKNNDGHLAILHIANIARDVFNFQVKIKTSFFTYIKLKYKYFSWLKRTKTDEIDIEQFIQFIEDANNEKGIFAKIYQEYYKRNER